jgi:TonB family protein
VNAAPKPPVRPTCPPRTYSKVALIHGALLLLLVLFSLFSFRKPADKYIEMVELGTSNPGKGEYDGEEVQGGGGSRDALPPAPEPPPPVQPPTPVPTPPVPVVPPVPVTPPQPVPPPKPQQAVEPPKPAPPKPAPPKPAPVTPPKPAQPDKPKAAEPRKVSLKEVTRTTGGNGASASQAPAKAAGKGPGTSEGDIKKGLKEGLKAAGVPDGTGSGRYGDPNGSPDASSYLTLLRYEVRRAWRKPALTDPSLTGQVRVRILRDGTLVFKGIEQSSGNAVFDDSVRDAVRACGRLSKPLPPGLGNPDYEVVVQFELKD